jgi:uncharacterized repeat protein (TIGR01451 family)
VEPLESRCLLAAASLPAITGTALLDGQATPGVTVRLYQDDGDGVFEPGNGDPQVGGDLVTAADDGSTPENEAGSYAFGELSPDGAYFVQQPAQSAGNSLLRAQVSDLIRPGRPQLLIDDFATRQVTIAAPPPPSRDTDSRELAETEVLGGERDLAVELLTGSAEIELRVNPFGLDDVLLFDSAAGTQGTRRVTWDGVDGDGGQLAMNLDGVDLTQGGQNTGLMMRAGVDNNGATVRVRLYEGSADDYSELSAPIPVTGGTAAGVVFLPFADFPEGASPTSVDAIELYIDTGSESVDGQIDIVGAAGPYVVDFTNRSVIDLELTKTADVTTAGPGDTVIWRVEVDNNVDSATTAATGVEVRDVLPDGMTLVRATPSGNGTFADGVWRLVNRLLPGQSASLDLEATVQTGTVGGTVLRNQAEVIAADQEDIDSTPGTGVPDEDDRDAAEVAVTRIIDLELSKSAGATEVEPGEELVWTVVVRNNAEQANSAATGVQISDSLPAGLDLVRAEPDGNGTFSNGVWTLNDPLQPGADAQLLLVTRVQENVADGALLRNVAEVTAASESDADSEPGNADASEDDQDEARVDVRAVIDLEVTKSADRKLVVDGDTITWTVTVRNNPSTARASATGVRLRDTADPGLTIVDAGTDNGTFADGLWTLANPLPPGASAELVLVTTVNSQASGTRLVNFAEVVASDQTDVDSTPNVSAQTAASLLSRTTGTGGDGRVNALPSSLPLSVRPAALSEGDFEDDEAEAAVTRRSALSKRNLLASSTG